VRSVWIVLALVACNSDKADRPKPPPKPKPAAPAVPAAPPVEANAGPAELLPADGAVMDPLPIAKYTKEIAARADAVVVATRFPPKLSKAAGAGVNLFTGDRNVSWVIDGDTFIYDANANGDLTDDSPAKLVGNELTITQHVAGALKGSLVDAPVRIRRTAKGLFAQEAAARRGTLALPKGPMAFALLGDRGRFGQDYQIVAFDLNRDGKLDLETLDAPEQVRMFEQTVTLDGQGYLMQVELDGSSIALIPVAAALPPRAPLQVGTVAPEIAVTSFEGKPVKLSDLRGKVVLIDFWATFCKPCIKAFPRLKALRTTHAPHGFELLSIAMPTDDDPRAVLGEFAAGIDAIDDAAQTTFRVDRFPTYFLIDGDGKILCSRCQLDEIEPMIIAQVSGR
jgi:thiol-disulfide isomerase/thioredoxin